jgi:hypothetical protein
MRAGVSKPVDLSDDEVAPGATPPMSGGFKDAAMGMGMNLLGNRLVGGKPEEKPKFSWGKRMRRMNCNGVQYTTSAIQQRKSASGLVPTALKCCLSDILKKETLRLQRRGLINILI